jgi:hypothetical protein
MLEDLKKAQHGGKSQDRLRIYVAAALLIGLAIYYMAANSKTAPEPAPDATPAATVLGLAPSPPPVDLSKLPARDDDAEHDAIQLGPYEYALGYVREHGQGLAGIARRMAAGELDALPFPQARGQVFEVRGKVVAMVRQAWPTDTRRLWQVVVQGKDGGRVVVIKDAFASDEEEGRPLDALGASTNPIAEDDLVVVRGLYLQRRTGTVGHEILREPVPVLLAAPPNLAFRKTRDLYPPITDPREADWDEVKDRFLAETRNLDEPALYQVLAWAKRRGHDAIREDLRTGKLQAEPFEEPLFLRWADELESVKTANDPRPLTDSLRGRLFTTSGLLANFVYLGWDKIPHTADGWGVDSFYLLDLCSDHHGNAVLRTATPWTLGTFPGITGARDQHVRITGFFLKNHSYEKKEGGPITTPFFIVIDVQPAPPGPSPYRELIWIVAGAICVLGFLFWLVLVRGEGRESRRLTDYRMSLRRRIRERSGGPRLGGPPAADADADADAPDG